MIPFFGCEREHKADMWKYLRVAQKVLSSGRMLQGTEGDRLETSLSNYLGKSVRCVGSCTDALFFALKLLNLNPGDKVLTTSFSFVATASAIIRAGLVPVFGDVELETGNLDLERLNCPPDARAIIPVHLYGRMLDPKALQDYAISNSLYIIEDAAQALGGSADGVQAGRVGELACFSFDPTKNISAPGSGGAIAYPEAWDVYVQDLRYHGKNFGGLGYNSQLPELSAAFINLKLTSLNLRQQKREKIAMFYIERLQNCVQTPKMFSGHTWHKFVVRTNVRNDLMEYLLAHEIEVKIHYPTPLHKMSLFSSPSKCPNAELLSETVLSLPIHPYLSDAEVETVVDEVKSFFD